MAHDQAATARPPERRGKLTLEEKERARILADKGWSHGRVAVALGRHSGALQYHFAEWGLLPLKQPRPVQPSGYMRGGKLVRRFTVAEDELIEKRRMEDDSLTEIGRLVGRPINSIRNRLAQLAATQEAGADA